MKISRITLDNFRQHRNLQLELDSSASSFTVIKGRNGAGKTNLLKAISWALTGKLAKDEAKFDVNSLVSISAAKEASNGDKIEVSVKLDLDLGTLGLAQLVRTARFVKTGTQAGDLAFSASELLVLTMADKSKGFQKEPNPDLWIEKVFPERFSHYFLFDGEHLHRFFKDTEAAYVKRAVLEIANIDQLEKMVDHLANVNQQLVKETGSVAGVKGEELRKDYESVEVKMNKLKSELVEKENLRIELDDALLGSVKGKIHIHPTNGDHESYLWEDLPQAIEVIQTILMTQMNDPARAAGSSKIHLSGPITGIDRKKFDPSGRF